jgi:hypothetical protein
MSPELSPIRRSQLADRLIAAGWRPATAYQAAARVEQREPDDRIRSCVECAYSWAPLQQCCRSGYAGSLQRRLGFLATLIRPAEAPTRPATAASGGSPYFRESST